jgi:eukaryotic-like serine/threonine-protein kinase
MASDQAQRVAELVKSALERDPTEWLAFLDQACAGDEKVRTEVDSLLRFREEASGFIEKPALHVAAETFVGAQSLAAEQLIAGYRVLSKIGEGGMGDVYLAEDIELHRKVALKLVRAGISTDEIVSRFRHEERILASLNHPNIAQLTAVARPRTEGRSSSWNMSSERGSIFIPAAKIFRRMRGFSFSGKSARPWITRISISSSIAI